MKREAFDKINHLLNYFPAVVILGARQCGKTTLAKALRPSWRYIDLDSPADLARFQEQDPSFYLHHYDHDLIIDEAQAYPAVFDILRGVIDEKREWKGRFILTGSSSPELLQQVSNSLAGRVAIVELSTLVGSEMIGAPTPAFYHYFEGGLTADQLLKMDKPLMTTETVHRAWLQGGYPEPVLSNDPHFFELWMAEYQKTYLFRDVAKLFPRLNHPAYQRFLSILARLSGTILNKSELARSIEVSEPTIKDYLQIAEGTFLWRSIPSFDKRPLKQLTKMPKGHFRDSGLLNYLLRISTLDDLLNHPHVGHLFESFVIETLLKHMGNLSIVNWQARYYRTKNGAEVDLILEGAFGCLPIEIKLGHTVTQRHLTSLKAFMSEEKCPLGLVINQAESLMALAPNILQIPARYLV